MRGAYVIVVVAQHKLVNLQFWTARPRLLGGILQRNVGYLGRMFRRRCGRHIHSFQSRIGRILRNQPQYLGGLGLFGGPCAEQNLVALRKERFRKYHVARRNRADFQQTLVRVVELLVCRNRFVRNVHRLPVRNKYPVLRLDLRDGCNHLLLKLQLADCAGILRLQYEPRVRQKPPAVQQRLLNRNNQARGDRRVENICRRRRGVTVVVQQDVERRPAVQLLRVAQIDLRVMHRLRERARAGPHSARQRIIYRSRRVAHAAVHRDDRIENSSSPAADDELPQWRPSSFRLQNLRFVNPRRVFGNRNIQIVFQRQRNRVWQTQIELSVLDQAVNRRRVLKVRARDTLARVRRENIRERALPLAVIPHIEQARIIHQWKRLRPVRLRRSRRFCLLLRLSHWREQRHARRQRRRQQHGNKTSHRVPHHFLVLSHNIFEARAIIASGRMPTCKTATNRMSLNFKG